MQTNYQSDICQINTFRANQATGVLTEVFSGGRGLGPGCAVFEVCVLFKNQDTQCPISLTARSHVKWTDQAHYYDSLCVKQQKFISLDLLTKEGKIKERDWTDQGSDGRGRRP